MKERFEICEDTEECLTFKGHKKYAVAVARKWVEQTQLFASNKIMCFDKQENIQNYSVTLLIRKDFECMNEVNDIIRKSLEAGLIQKWKQDGQSIKFHENVNAFSSHSYLQLSDMVVLAIGLFIVIFLVSAELVVNNRMESMYRYNLSIFVYKSFWTRRHAFFR